jgi:cell division protein FtsL
VKKDNSINLENEQKEDKEKEVIKKKGNYFSKLSKFEKIFWITLLVIFLPFLTLIIMGNFNSENFNGNTLERTPLSKSIAEKLISSDLIKKQLLKNEAIITKKLDLEISNLDKNISNEIDKSFIQVEKNIDTFLDFHYSVIGEYAELIALATNDIGKLMKEKLFGEDFNNSLIKAYENINLEYKTGMNKYINSIDNVVLKDVDIELNDQSLQRLRSDININAFGKGGNTVIAVASARIIPKIVKVIVAKIAIKVAAKTSSKVAAKAATSGAAASGGVVCGPAVVVCAPIAAIGAWVATDIAIVSGDEYLNRAKFKDELLQTLNDNKQKLKDSYSNLYKAKMINESKTILEAYRNIEIKKRVKIKDRF